jgi:tetratricopeptide (TPR) repeat protein
MAAEYSAMRVRAAGFGLAALVIAAPTVAREVRQGNLPTPHGGTAPMRIVPFTASTSASLPLVNDPRLDMAMSAIQARNPQRALDLVQPLLVNFEQRYASEKRQIYCAVNSVQSLAYMAEAASVKREAVAIEPAWCRAQYIRAFALVDLKRLDEAQEGYQRLVRYAPQNSRYLNELGYVLQQKKQWQASVDIDRRSDMAANLASGGADVERCVALRGIGYDLVELGKLDEAESSYRKCLAITPNDAKSLQQIDYIREQRKNTI